MKPRFRYPTAPPRDKTLYEHTCIDCGAVRKNHARPDSTRAPKLCRDCHGLRQDRLLSQIVRTPHTFHAMRRRA